MYDVLPRNRRQSHRAHIAMAVRNRIGDRTYLCQAADISADGIFLASVHEGLLPSQAKCSVEFSLPGSEVLISARGRLVRQTMNGRYHLAAIRFAAIAPSHRRLIQRYVRSPGDAAQPVFLR